MATTMAGDVLAGKSLRSRAARCTRNDATEQNAGRVALVCLSSTRGNGINKIVIERTEISMLSDHGLPRWVVLASSRSGSTGAMQQVHPAGTNENLSQAVDNGCCFDGVISGQGEGKDI